MKRLLCPCGTHQESLLLPSLGRHITIDAERFSEDLPRDEYNRLMHGWFRAALPRATFQCDKLTLGGE